MKSTTKWILTVVGFALVALCIIALFAQMDANTKTRSVNAFNYAIGAIDTTTGKVVDSHKSIYTKDFGNVDGLEIKMTDNASITYSVFIYNEDKELLDVVAGLDDDLIFADLEDVDSTAKYFKVMITPNQVDGEDVNVTLFTVAKYVGMLKITYNK